MFNLRRPLRSFHRGRSTARRTSATPLALSSSSQREEEEDPDLPRAIARLINGHPTAWSPHLESALSTLAYRLTPSALLRALDLVKPPSAALRLFQWARPRLPLDADHRPASKMLHLLLRSPDLRPARDFLISLHSSSAGAACLPDHSFNALIRAHAGAGRLRDAISLFRQMPALGVPPSAFSFNALLSAVLRRGRTRSAARLYREMLPAVPPDVCTFNTLIRGFCLNSMVDEGFRFFREMSLRGCRPDVVTYNTLLDGLCRAGKVRTAHNLLNGMRTKSPELSPNVVSYTTLIRGYCSKLQAAEAVALFEEMAATGLKPNRITYNTLIQGLCNARRMDMVKEILEGADGESGDAGFRPDTCTFNILIAGHCNAGSIGVAQNVFEKMLQLRVKPDSATYSTLIRALCRSGNFARSEELVDELLEKGALRSRGGCAPLIAAYNPIFVHLCQNGKAEKAGRLFQQLSERRAKIDVGAFKTLILGHCKEGAFGEGYKLVSLMVRRDLRPDVETFEALIEGFLGKGNAGLAWKSLVKMLGSGHRPSASAFHVVLAGLLKKDGCAEEAGNLVAVMLERKIRQNADLSTDVVAGLFRNGLHDRAFEIVGLLYDNGYCVKMEMLVEHLCHGAKLLEARELLLFSLEKHQNLDGNIWGMVVDGLCATGRALEAFGLFREATEKGCAISSRLDDLEHALEVTGRSKEAEFVSKKMSRASAGRTGNHM